MATGASDRNRCVGVLSEVQHLVEAVRAGKLDYRIETHAYDGEAAQILALTNSIVDELVTPLRIASGSLAEIASGRVPEFVIDEYHGEFETIKRNINTFLATMQGIHHEAQDLISAITSGRLHARGNEWDFQGTWRDLICGMNAVVEAFERPFDIASGCVREISDGNLPAPISQNLKGEYGRLARNLNELLSTVRHMIREVVGLAQAAVEGRLEERIVCDEFSGDWRVLVAGINNTLDSALAPIQEAGQVLEQVAAYNLAARVLGQYAGDHARIKDSLNRTAETLNRTMRQVSASTNAVAVAGEQIAQAAERVNVGTQRQVDAVKTIMQKTALLADQAQGNAEMSRSALERATEVNLAVSTGRDGAERVAEVMTQVVSATDASTAVIREIDDIAALTDTLAQSANAEAAKVAASGRGFAVVADEVRRLAQMSKLAAQKIDALIADVGRLLATSTETSNRSTQDAIAAVVQEIQQISLQTNMLAVNAAVEAAHVAAASAGFETITGEVRNLAQRVKGAAERTSSLTRGAHGAAESGQAIAVELSSHFAEIIHGVGSMRKSVEEIATATEAQQAGMRSVAQAMASIEEVTDANARSAADSTQVAQSLTDEMSALTELVGQFSFGMRSACSAEAAERGQA